MTTNKKQEEPEKKKGWVRIPDGTKVRHRLDGDEGFIDGLTEILTGPQRNPDGRTQYRVNVGGDQRRLAAEDELLILTDENGIVLMLKKQTIEYRNFVSQQLQGNLGSDRFVKPA